MELLTKVKDTGIGMNAEEISQLFQFFVGVNKSKKDNKGGGMGFGLTVSKMIVSQLKGDIKVRSKPGQGSTFTFKIKIDDYIDSDIEESKSVD